MEKTIHDYMEQTAQSYFLELKREKHNLWMSDDSLFELLDNPRIFVGRYLSSYVYDIVEMYKRFEELQEKEGTDYKLF